MTEGSPRQSAKIYQFPPGGRATSGVHNSGAKSVTELWPMRLPRAAIGSGWYHDAAIEEAEQTRKR